MPRPVASLVALCFFTFFLGLGGSAITDSDEAFYAEASREMVERGDWLTPRFNYQDRWQKPILYYWLTAATFTVTGPTESAARLWAALSGVGLVLLTWAAARQLTRRDDCAWIAGAVTATCFGYFAMARAALPDLPLAFFITACIWAALRAADGSGPASLRWWGLAGLSGGLGFLTKGPVAVVIPAIVLLPIWWRERRTLAVGWRGVLAATVVGAAVGLPWYLAMAAEHGSEYIQSFFVGDNLERFATDRFNDPRPVWFYGPVLLGGLLPWSVYAAAFAGNAGIALARRARRLTGAEWRLVLWAAMPLLFFTLSIGKQPRYILPVLPPLAILLATAFVERVNHGARSDRLLGGATWITAIVFALLGVLLVRMQPLFINSYPAATWTGAAALGCAALAVGWVAATRRWAKLPVILAAGGVVLMLAIEFGAESGRRPEAVEQIAAAVRTHRTAGEPIGAYRTFVRNLVFYTGAGQTELYDWASAVAFLKSRERVLLVMNAEDAPGLEAASGGRLRTLAQVEYLNTADIRLRTILGADPEQEIETVILVSNR